MSARMRAHATSGDPLPDLPLGGRNRFAGGVRYCEVRRSVDGALP